MSSSIDPINGSIKAVLFDLDGTLLDTAPDLAAVVNQLCAEQGYPAVSYERIRTAVSYGAKGLVQAAFTRPSDTVRHESLRLELLARYRDHLAVYTTPFEGIPELLTWLDDHDIAWGIVTNKLRQHSAAIVSAFGWEQRCGVLVCADDVRHTKPHPEPLLRACDTLLCQPEQAIYVGDHARDVQAGAHAHMRTIAATYGYVHPEESIEQWGADFRVERPEEIVGILQNLAVNPP